MSTATQSSALLQLPDEILLQIALNLPGSIKQPNPQGDLLSLALTCKQLGPLAREALCHAPILRSNKTHVLLETLFKYPELCTKVRSLTIETKETRGEKLLSYSIPGLEGGLLRNCIRAIQTLPFDLKTRERWIADIKASSLKCHSLLICLLIPMLSQLERLYLGGTVLLHLSLFRQIRPLLDDWDFPSLSVMSLLGPKLKVLELPNDFRVYADAPPQHVPKICGLPMKLPALRKLILPSSEVEGQACQDIIPRQLEVLILKNVLPSYVRQNKISNWICDVARAKKLHFPHLRKVAVYYRCKKPPAAQPFLALMADVGLEYFEYCPYCYCCLPSHDESSHP